jgi:ATP-binding cassette subfamily C protein
VTLVAATVLIGLSAAFLRATNRAHRRLGASLEAVGRTSLRHLQEAVGGIKEIKVLGREAFFADEFARDQRTVARVRARLAGLAALPRIVVETLFVCGTLAVVVLVAPGPESLPLLGLYAYAGFRVIPSAHRIVWLLGEMRAGAAAVDRVRGDLVAASRRTPFLRRAAGRACAFRDGFALDASPTAYDGGARH